MIKIKIEGKWYKVPTSWREVTTEQFQRIKECNLGDLVKFLSVITGCEYSIIHNCRQLDIDAKVLPYMGFLETPLLEENLPAATTITIEEKSYPIPTDLGDCTFGQKIAATKVINKAIEAGRDSNSCLAEVTAIYMQPIIQGASFDYGEAKKMIPLFEQCSIVEVYHVGGFFLKKLVAYQNAKALPYPLNQIKNKLVLAYLNWIYSRRSTRLMRSRGEIS